MSFQAILRVKPWRLSLEQRRWLRERPALLDLYEKRHRTKVF
jgi:hypothetical protein